MRLKRNKQPFNWQLIAVLIVLVVGFLIWQAYTSAPSEALVPTQIVPTSASIDRPTSPTSPTSPTRPAKPITRPGAPTQPAQATAPVSANRNLQLGNPSGAVHDSAAPNNYLIERPQYVLSYNRDHGIPNWVSWQLTKKDLGPVARSPTFSADTTLPDSWYHVTLDDYTATGYDRGHMCPSADRTATVKDNLATFILTNVVPQAPDNNRGTWEHLEAFSRTLVDRGHTLYIIAGGDGKIGAIAKGKILVPAYTWKIIVVMPKGQSDMARITATTPVIAVRIPNSLKAKLGDWDQYRVTVDSIESATGYHFFTNLPTDVQTALKSRIDSPPTN